MSRLSRDLAMLLRDLTRNLQPMNVDNDSSGILSALDKALGAWLNGLEAVYLYGPVSEAAYRASKKVFLAGLRRRNHFKIENSNHVPWTGGVLLASNHQSWLDVFALACACPRRIHYVAKSEFATWPFVRHGVAFAGSVFIKRGGDDEALLDIVNNLDQGKAVAIFPEGTIPGEEEIPRRQRDPLTGLLQGRTGVIRMALRANVPIVPVGISGTERALPPEVWPRRELFRLPSKAPITIRFGEPIYLKSVAKEEVDGEFLRLKTNDLMTKISDLVYHRSNYPPTIVPAPPRGKADKVGVLVLHDFAANPETTRPLVSRVKAEGFLCEAPVLRGHGTRYQDLMGVTAKDWYVDSEHALIQLWDRVDKVVVVGVSMGGLVGLELAMRHPDKIAGIVSVATCLKFEDAKARFAKKMSTAVKFWPTPTGFSDPVICPKNENYDKFPVETFASLYEYSRNMAKRLAEVHLPIRILQSKADTVVSPLSASTIYQQVSSTEREMVWYQKTDHAMLQDVEADKVVSDVMEFIYSFRKDPHET